MHNEKILLIGKNGQVGWELRKPLSLLGDLVSVGRSDIDLTDQESIHKMIRTIKPTLIVNAASYTFVDKAEEEIELAFAINEIAPFMISKEAKRIGAMIIHTLLIMFLTARKPYHTLKRTDQIRSVFMANQSLLEILQY